MSYSLVSVDVKHGIKQKNVTVPPGTLYRISGYSNTSPIITVSTGLPQEV